MYWKDFKERVISDLTSDSKYFYPESWKAIVACTTTVVDGKRATFRVKDVIAEIDEIAKSIGRPASRAEIAAVENKIDETYTMKHVSKQKASGDWFITTEFTFDDFKGVEYFGDSWSKIKSLMGSYPPRVFQAACYYIAKNSS